MVSLLVNLKERFSLNIGIGVSTSALIGILKSYLLTHLCLVLVVISRTLWQQDARIFYMNWLEIEVSYQHD